MDRGSRRAGGGSGRCAARKGPGRRDHRRARGRGRRGTATRKALVPADARALPRRPAGRSSWRVSTGTGATRRRTGGRPGTGSSPTRGSDRRTRHCARNPCGTRPSLGHAHSDLSADRHRGIHGCLGGRRRRHGRGPCPPRRARRTGRHVPRRPADQDTWRGRCHLLSLRAGLGGCSRRYRAARRNLSRTMGHPNSDADPRRTAYRRSRAARRRLLRSGG